MVRTLRSRIALAYAALIVAAMAALGLSLLRTEERRYRAQLDERLEVEARLVAEALAPALQSGATIERVDPLAKRLGREGGVRVTVIAPDGRVLGDSENDPLRLDNHAGRPEVNAALATGLGRASRHSETEDREYSYVAVPVVTDGATEGVARVSTPESTIEAVRRQIAVSVAAAAAVAALVAALLAALIAGAVTRPLEQLRRAATALAGGAFDQRVPVRGGTEVGELATAFNEMAERLRDTVHDLAYERSRLVALLAASASALLALDRDGVIRYQNPAAESLLGPATGRSFSAVARNHVLSAMVRDALAGRGGDGVTVQLRPVVSGLQSGGARRAVASTSSVEGGQRWLQATARPISGGGDWASLVILQDVTDLRLAETTRRDFVANVSHELRTPLAGIKAVVETLRDGALDDRDAARDFLGRVDAEVDRLVQLVEELLQLARIESGAAPMAMAPVLPRDLLAGVVDRFRPQAERDGVDLTVAGDDAGPIVGDAERLGQAVGNLVHNALKFTPRGGRVVVGAEQADGIVRLTVADSGAGIDPADLPRIFERFYVADRSRSRRGTGLGLAIVKHVVRAHGGDVTVESTPGKGSTFTIELPA